MRQTKKKLIVISCFSLLFITLSVYKAFADLILHTKLLTSNTFTKILGEKNSSKNILLIHILNFTDTPLIAGTYEIGIENLDKKNKLSKDNFKFTYKPTISIKPGEIKTLKLALPSKLNNNLYFEKQPNLNIYLKTANLLVLASKESKSKEENVNNMNNSISVLYTEAPIEDYANIVPPNEIEFEQLATNNNLHQTQITQINNNIQKKPSNLDSKQTSQIKTNENQIKELKNKSEKKHKESQNDSNKNLLAHASPTSSKNNLNFPTTSNQPSTSKLSESKTLSNIPSQNTNQANTTKQPRKIKPSEFKSLRTIDEELIIYVIKEGDTIKDIAASYYGNPSYENRIKELNFIENESTIRIGEEIIVDVKQLNKSTSSNTNNPPLKSSNKM